MRCPSEGQEPLSVPLIPPHVPALITHKGRPLQGSLGRMLLLHATGPSLQEYLCAKYKWTSSTFTSIDWMAHGTAFQCYPRYIRHSISKTIHFWRPTLNKLHRIDPQQYPTNICTICNKALETNHHIFQCTHQLSRVNQQKFLGDLKK